MRRVWLPGLAAVLIGILGTACGSGAKQAPKLAPTEVAAAPSPPPTVQPPPPDPVELLIEQSQRLFETGQKELELGHLEQARRQFDQALDVLLESRFGARGEPRIREHFDRLVDRISAYEISALAKGDGFAEKTTEPASLDELLALSTTFETAPPPAPELEEAIKSDLERTEHDIPIPLNTKVLQYVELFQGRLREWFNAGLQRGSQYLPMIQEVFRAEGVPLDLAYVPLIESAFKPTALSRAKARGIWQFMRGTAAENGLKHDWYIDERSDPEKATQAAAKYLLTLKDIFDGDWHLALASYNGGPGRVQRAMKRTRRDDFWSLSSGRVLPRETREYVPMILAAIIIARNPVEYGFQEPAEAPVAFERVALSTAVDLRRIAEWTGASIDEIQALNPELRRWTTPLRDTNYEIKVPVGTAEVVKSQLAIKEQEDLVALNWHTVKKGESLASIARKLKVRSSDLAEANYLTTRSKVKTGQKLIVPREPTTLLAARTERPAPLFATGTVEPRLALASPAVADERPATEAPEPTVTRVVYRVKRGDSLSSIARLFNTSVAALKRWNSKIKGTRIAAGDRLVIFATRVPAGTR
ncbi:MAG TPA: LysM peptidoglycan-binding domain-containing protein [Vicinamibacterales bacterium]